MSGIDTTDTTQTRDQRGRKVRALLAGGLVLGVGAAITLAAWTDNEFGTGAFAAGQFNLQGSTTSATTGFTDHNTAGGAATLGFTTPSMNLSPSDSVYAPFWVRLTADTTTAANLQLTGLTSTGTAAGQLDYSIYSIANTATCNATTASGTPIATGTLSDTTATSSVVPLPKPVSPAAGDAQQLCFVVTAKPSVAQNTTATATWQFTATSTQ